jgi:hypothetical protein
MICGVPRERLTTSGCCSHRVRLVFPWNFYSVQGIYSGQMMLWRLSPHVDIGPNAQAPPASHDTIEMPRYFLSGISEFLSQKLQALTICHAGSLGAVGAICFLGRMTGR